MTLNIGILYIIRNGFLPRLTIWDCYLEIRLRMAWINCQSFDSSPQKVCFKIRPLSSRTKGTITMRRTWGINSCPETTMGVAGDGAPPWLPYARPPTVVGGILASKQLILSIWALPKASCLACAWGRRPEHRDHERGREVYFERERERKTVRKKEKKHGRDREAARGRERRAARDDTRARWLKRMEASAPWTKRKKKKKKGI